MVITESKAINCEASSLILRPPVHDLLDAGLAIVVLTITKEQHRAYWVLVLSLS